MTTRTQTTSNTRHNNRLQVNITTRPTRSRNNGWMESSATTLSQTSNPPTQRLCSMRNREEKPRSPRLRLRKKINQKEKNIEASRNVQKHNTQLLQRHPIERLLHTDGYRKAPAELRCSIKPQWVELQVSTTIGSDGYRCRP
jgi:hypothetical protein